MEKSGTKSASSYSIASVWLARLFDILSEALALRNHKHPKEKT